MERKITTLYLQNLMVGVTVLLLMVMSVGGYREPSIAHAEGSGQAKAVSGAEKVYSSAAQAVSI